MKKTQVPDYINKKINYTREILMTQIAIIASTLIGLLLLISGIQVIGKYLFTPKWIMAAEQSALLVIYLILSYGNICYFISRKGYLKRVKEHQRAAREELLPLFSSESPSVTALVPSYKENPHTVKQTLLSLALQEYPDKEVVLLIDDPPGAQSREDKELLEKTRNLPAEIEAMLEKPAGEFISMGEQFLKRTQKEYHPREEMRFLQEGFTRLSKWFEEQAESYPRNSHTDEFFVEKIFHGPARRWTRFAQKIDSLLTEGGGNLYDQQRCLQEYNCMASIFTPRLHSFERKQYEKLSHGPNKAMNLNAYISLMGKSFTQREAEGKLFIEECKEEEKLFSIRATDYVIILDADSLVDPDYAVRFIGIMEKQENERIALVQASYSAVPNAPGVLERVAGVMTNMLYIMHQGSSHYNSAFWVGANSCIRYQALLDICEEGEERGYPVKSYIQDRTVIEDTESSIDLLDKGWTLYNYPERIAYSETPHDFGSLLIQRRRWSNGGLLIFPKLAGNLKSRKKREGSLAEAFLRSYYLLSPTLINSGILLLFLGIFNDHGNYLLVFLLSIPYFFIYARDILLHDYSLVDLLRLYALNLILLPVNLAGVFKSIEQGIMKKKIPFKATPKISGQTSISPIYLIFYYGALIYMTGKSCLFLYNGNWNAVTFCLINGAAVFYGIAGLIGFKSSLRDLFKFKLAPQQ